VRDEQAVVLRARVRLGGQIEWIEQHIEELRPNKYLVSNVARPEMLGCDDSDRCLDLVCHSGLGVRGRLISERKRLAATVPLVDEVVFATSVCVR